MFMPQTTDVYDRKNMPKVIYCIHVLRYGLLYFDVSTSPRLSPPHPTIGNCLLDPTGFFVLCLMYYSLHLLSDLLVDPAPVAWPQPFLARARKRAQDPEPDKQRRLHRYGWSVVTLATNYTRGQTPGGYWRFLFSPVPTSLLTLADEEIASVTDDLQTYAAAMPQFGNIGGALAKEAHIDMNKSMLHWLLGCSAA
jgi:hypothetical protein